MTPRELAKRQARCQHPRRARRAWPSGRRHPSDRRAWECVDCFTISTPWPLTRAGELATAEARRARAHERVELPAYAVVLTAARRQAAKPKREKRKRGAR